MPIYQYLCNECGHQADYLVSKVGEVPVGCKACSSADLLKVIHGQIFGIGSSSKSSSERIVQQDTTSSSGTIEVVVELPALIVRTLENRVVGFSVITSEPEKDYGDMN